MIQKMRRSSVLVFLLVALSVSNSIDLDRLPNLWVAQKSFNSTLAVLKPTNLTFDQVSQDLLELKLEPEEVLYIPWEEHGELKMLFDKIRLL
jgi:hypothetical protein